MTEVAFHTQLPDKLGYTCRLLRKAWRQGLRVAVVGQPEQLGRLDQALWMFEQEEFVPHLRLRTGQPMPAAAARTPICLLDDGRLDVQASVLVNLGPEFPVGVERFGRVVEVVSTDLGDVELARPRWKQYLASGLAPVNRPYVHEASAPTEPSASA